MAPPPAWVGCFVVIESIVTVLLIGYCNMGLCRIDLVERGPADPCETPLTASSRLWLHATYACLSASEKSCEASLRIRYGSSDAEDLYRDTLYKSRRKFVRFAFLGALATAFASSSAVLHSCALLRRGGRNLSHAAASALVAAAAACAALARWDALAGAPAFDEAAWGRGGPCYVLADSLRVNESADKVVLTVVVLGATAAGASAARGAYFRLTGLQPAHEALELPPLAHAVARHHTEAAVSAEAAPEARVVTTATALPAEAVAEPVPSLDLAIVGASATVI